MACAAGTAAGAQSIPCDTPYTIVRGETLGAISTRAFGPGKLSQFYALNQSVIGPNPDQIEIGMVLTVPCSLTATAPALAETTAEAAATQTASAVSTLPAQTSAADFSAAPLSNEPQSPDAMPDEAEVVLTFNKASAPKFVINTAIIDPYLKKISEVTEGRVQFIDPPVVNRDARAQLELVEKGQADAAYVFNGYLQASHPLLQLPMQPMMGGMAYQTAVALWELHDAHLSDVDSFGDVRLLGFVGAPAAHIWRLREAPVVPGEDLVKTNEYTVPYFDGLDTRGAAAVREENASWLAAYDEKQGNPLTFAMAHGAARAGGIWNDNRTVTELPNGVYTPTFSVIISDAAWDRISEADQEAILSVSGRVLSEASERWDEFDNGHRRIMIEQGLDVVKADVELLAELQDRSRAGLDRWIITADRMGLQGYDALQFYSDTLRAVAKPSEF